MDTPHDRPSGFGPFVAVARRDLRETVAGLLAARRDAIPTGAFRPPFLAAEAVAAARRDRPDPAAPSELRAYARPAGAPARAQYRLHAVLAGDLAPEALVGAAYEAVLGRPADAAGAAGYVAATRSGSLDPRGLLASLAGSQEARARGLDFVFVLAQAGTAA